MILKIMVVVWIILSTMRFWFERRELHKNPKELRITVGTIIVVSIATIISLILTWRS